MVKLVETAPDTMTHTWMDPVLSSTEYPSGGASKLTAAYGRRITINGLLASTMTILTYFEFELFLEIMQ